MSNIEADIPSIDDESDASKKPAEQKIKPLQRNIKEEIKEEEKDEPDLDVGEDENTDT